MFDDTGFLNVMFQETDRLLGQQYSDTDNGYFDNAKVSGHLLVTIQSCTGVGYSVLACFHPRPQSCHKTCFNQDQMPNLSSEQH